jgi:hypothetical protein
MNVEIRLGKVRKALEQKMREAVSKGDNHQLMVYKSLWEECLDPTNIIDQLAYQSWEEVEEELDQHELELPRHVWHVIDLQAWDAIEERFFLKNLES